MHIYLLASVLILFTLFGVESLRDYLTLIDQATQTRLAIADQYGDSIPINLQTSLGQQFFGTPFGLITNLSIFIFGWLSIVVFAIYKRKNNIDAE